MHHFFRRRICTPAGNNRISVTGDAANIEGSAVIITEGRLVYFIEGMNAWEQGWLGCRVKVMGDLYQKEHADNPVSYKDNIIKRAVILLLNEGCAC